MLMAKMVGLPATALAPLLRAVVFGLLFLPDGLRALSSDPSGGGGCPPASRRFAAKPSMLLDFPPPGVVFL
jgi:hypothetical protein